MGLPPAPVSAHRQVLIAYDKIAAADRSDLWSTLRSREDVLVEAKAVDERVRAGERFPLAGLLVAVTEYIAGLPRPGGGEPAVRAVAIQRLIQAGAVVLGKTGPCAATRSHIHNSALAVALGLVDVAVATEAPGSGGVDSDVGGGVGSGVDTVWNGVVGIRPTRGLVPMTGMATAASAGHGVLVFARTVATAHRALVAMTGPDPSDPASRHWPDLVCLAAGERPRVAVADLSSFAKETGRVYQQAISDLLAAGALVETIDVRPVLAAQSGAPVEEAGQGGWPHAWDGYRALVLPAVPGTAGVRPRGHPDLTGLREAAAVTVPYDRAGAWESGLTVLAPPFDDQVALDLAASLAGEQVNEPYPSSGADLVVFGAHLRGQPLNTSWPNSAYVFVARWSRPSGIAWSRCPRFRRRRALSVCLPARHWPGSGGPSRPRDFAGSSPGCRRRWRRVRSNWRTAAQQWVSSAIQLGPPPPRTSRRLGIGVPTCATSPRSDPWFRFAEHLADHRAPAAASARLISRIRPGPRSAKPV